MNWFKKALVWLGILAEAAPALADAAAQVAPLAGAGPKTQADIEKARIAANAANTLGQAAQKAADKLQQTEPPRPTP